MRATGQNKSEDHCFTRVLTEPDVAGGRGLNCKFGRLAGNLLRLLGAEKRQYAKKCNSGSHGNSLSNVPQGGIWAASRDKGVVRRRFCGSAKYWVNQFDPSFRVSVPRRLGLWA